MSTASIRVQYEGAKLEKYTSFHLYVVLGHDVYFLLREPCEGALDWNASLIPTIAAAFSKEQYLPLGRQKIAPVIVNQTAIVQYVYSHDGLMRVE